MSEGEDVGFPAPELAPEPGWTTLPNPPSMGKGRPYVSGEPKGDRLRVRYFRRESDGALVAKVWFGPGTEGPPGHAHGGSIAAVLDETMGGATWMAGHTTLSRCIEVHYRRMVPLGTEAWIEARVLSHDERTVRARAELTDADGGVYADGEGLFAGIDISRFTDLIEVADRIWAGEPFAPSPPDDGREEGAG